MSKFVVVLDEIKEVDPDLTAMYRMETMMQIVFHDTWEDARDYLFKEKRKEITKLEEQLKLLRINYNQMKGDPKWARHSHYGIMFQKR